MPENNDNDSRTETSDSSSPRGSSAPKIDRLGTFRIEKTLSSGGGGTVYLAFDESMKRRVALKVLHPSLNITDKAQERFAREAWIAGQLEHSNIIRVHSRGEENQFSYIAMEYAEGGSLSDYINQLRSEAAQSKDITITANREHIKSIVAKFIELANALEYIHSKAFIHRDIKPHNILLAGGNKQFKLTDFGIAHAKDMTRVTKAGDFFGTIHYMSPEQITAHRTTVDKRTDIYSLGVTLYEVLTLALPFEGDSEEKLIGEIIAGHYIPARKRLRHIPRDLETIMMKAAHLDPSRRYQSASALAEDLKRFLANRPVSARRDSLFYKARKHMSLNRRSNQVALTIILLLAVSGIVLTKVQQNRYDKEKILSSLKRAVATKTSPFEFEPEWPRLQKKLFNHVKEGKLDSTMIWFLKTAAMPKLRYQKFTLIDHCEIYVSLLRMPVIKYESVSGLPQVGSISNIFEVNTEGTGSKYHIYFEYDGSPSAGMTVQIKPRFNQYRVSSGELNTRINVITKHFVNVKLFQTIDEKFLWEYGSNIQQISTGKKVWPLESSEASSIENKDIVVLDKNLRIIEQPTYVDTFEEEIQIWAFDEWPKDFPAAVRDSNLTANLIEQLRIDRIILVRRNSGGDKSEFVMQIDWPKRMSSECIPVAGDFQITKGADGLVLLTGIVKIDQGNTYLQFHHDQATRFAVSDESDWFRSDTVSLGSISFDQLSVQGSISANLRIYPSIQIARLFGDLTKFCGDTLVITTLFEAIDQMNSN